MAIIMKKDDPWVKTDEKGLICHFRGPGVYEEYQKFLRRESKELQRAQDSRLAKERSPLGTLVMRIPADIFFGDKSVVRGEPDALARVWDKYEDFRMVRPKDGRNPFGKTKGIVVPVGSSRKDE